MHISLILLAAYIAKCLLYFLLQPPIPKEKRISSSSFGLGFKGMGTSDQELNKDRKRVFLTLATDGNFYVCWKILSMEYLFSWSLVPLIMLCWCLHDQTEDIMGFFSFQDLLYFLECFSDFSLSHSVLYSRFISHFTSMRSCSPTYIPTCLLMTTGQNFLKHNGFT